MKLTNEEMVAQQEQLAYDIEGLTDAALEVEAGNPLSDAQFEVIRAKIESLLISDPRVALGEYVLLRHNAVRYRLAGFIHNALGCERKAETRYNEIPAKYKW